jgi:aspartate/methionine/tyrosine aminotransferase
VLPGTSLDASGGSAGYLRLHFAAPPDVLTEAVRRLAAAWRAYDPPKTRTTAPPALAI